MSHVAGKAFAVNVLDIIGDQVSYQPAFSLKMWRGLMTALWKDLLRFIREDDGSE